MQTPVRILLVEDDPGVGPLMEFVLATAGYVVRLVGTLMEARMLLRHWTCELVLADVMLPDGNGITIADKAKARGIKTLVITAYAVQIPAKQLARHQVLLKPVRPGELVNAIERCLA